MCENNVYPRRNECPILFFSMSINVKLEAIRSKFMDVEESRNNIGKIRGVVQKSKIDFKYSKLSRGLV